MCPLIGCNIRSRRVNSTGPPRRALQAKPFRRDAAGRNGRYRTGHRSSATEIRIIPIIIAHCYICNFLIVAPPVAPPAQTWRAPCADPARPLRRPGADRAHNRCTLIRPLREGPLRRRAAAPWAPAVPVFRHRRFAARHREAFGLVATMLEGVPDRQSNVLSGVVQSTRTESVRHDRAAKYF